MTNPASKNLKHIYFNNLDACRFLAAFFVFIFHFSNEMRGLNPSLDSNLIFKTFYSFASKGSLGVNFFFVLSGFLITFLILSELKRTGKFNLGHFLLRRTLRIWPLYFLIILVGFFLFPLIFDGYSTQHSSLNYLFFLANFDEIKYGATESLNFLTSPWSVAVEEQFYLFWGIALFLLFKIKSFKIPHLLIILYLGSFYFRWLFWEDERIIYYHTLSVCQDILTGSLIGWSLFEKKPWLDILKKIPRSLTLLLYVIGLSVCVGKNIIFSGQLVIFERFVLSGFFGFVILDQIRGENSILKLGRFKFLNYLGKISYGLYMYHLLVMYLLVNYFLDVNGTASSLLFLFLSIILTFGISSLSFHFFESKFLSLKPKN